MKCQVCNGNGFVSADYPMMWKSCTQCNGTGEVFVCPKCGELASLSNWGSLIDHDYAWYNIECEKCGYRADGGTDPKIAIEMFVNGMGTQKELTVQEWMRMATTEQLADFFANTFDLCGAGCHHCFLAKICLEKAKNGNCLTQEQMIVEWLNSPHKVKS